MALPVGSADKNIRHIFEYLSGAQNQKSTDEQQVFIIEQDSALSEMVTLRKRNLLDISTTTSTPHVQGEKYTSKPRKRTHSVNYNESDSAGDENKGNDSNEDNNDTSEDYAERLENVGYLSYQTQMHLSMPIFEFPANIIYSMNMTTVPKGQVVGQEWDGTILLCHSDIFKCENTQCWIDAENTELRNLENHKMYIEVPISEVPKDAEIIPRMEVYLAKNHKDLLPDVVEKYKVRILVRGDYQVYSVNFMDTYSPVIKMSTLRFLIAMCTWYGLGLFLADTVGAYLNGVLDIEVYVQPPSFYSKKDVVWLLVKGLYGLKQAGQLWYKFLCAILIELGYTISHAGPCMLWKHVNSYLIVIAFYVDDILICCPPSIIDSIIKSLRMKIDITYQGRCEYHLGLELDYAPDMSYTILHQTKYFKMQDSMEVGADFKMRRDNEELLDLSVYDYNSLIGSLMYPCVVSRLDIAASVSLWSQNLHKPMLRYWNSAKQVLQYLKHTYDLGIVYYCSPNPIPKEIFFIGLTDASEPDNESRKAQTGWVFKFMGKSAMTWKSNKQKLVTADQTAAEHVAFYEGALEAPHLLNLCQDLQIKVTTPIKMFSDNDAFVKLVRENRQIEATKWMNRLYWKVQELYAEKTINCSHVAGVDNDSDMGTKALVCTQIVVVDRYLVKVL
ncbi:DNA-directed DNA polymerase [Chytriomyces confervae]|uniref:DNA-directed DNA polymerase n=1 Tax=Chytriomyces confervae TaxID=246404 RepID=A0A507F1J3_9FUNG|nr:DNA-directed DNA polymerase [Chytriomyces confervae]